MRSSVVQHPGARLIVAASPRMHQQGDGMSCGDDVVQQLHLIGVQGLPPRVAVQHGARRRQRYHGLGQQFRHRHRRLEYQGRVDHIAEIENAADRAPIGRHQQVGGVAVAVDGLTAQAPQAGQAGAKGAGDPLDGVTQLRGFDVARVFCEFGQAPHVPCQGPGQGWMKKSLQRSVDAGQGGADILQQRGARGRFGQQAPG
jgi:hypothetical protein